VTRLHDGRSRKSGLQGRKSYNNAKSELLCTERICGHFSSLPTARLSMPRHAENLANCTASPGAQCRSNPVSGRSLRKTGIIQLMARDFRHFRPTTRSIGSLEPATELRKLAIGGLFCDWLRSNLGPVDCLTGAEGFEPRYGDFEIGCSRLFERSYGTLFLGIHNHLETLEFQEPYRISAVHSFGDKCGF
jgi:hypothetical protein